MKNKRFKGIMPALITPVDERGEVREECARELIEAQIEMGVTGFYICGATGEGPALGEAARMRMTEISVAQAAGRADIIAHVGAADAHSAIRLAEHAARVGADGIASLPPTFFYPHGEAQIYDYYKALGDSCALPLLAYATGMFGQSDITPFIEKLMTIDTMVGLKFTRNNYYEMRRVAELNGGDINVINGPDETLICGLIMGADGGIGSTYNVMTREYVELYSAFTAGDYERARNKQFKINRAVNVLINHGVIPGIKRILSERGFDAGCAVFPGKRFTPDEDRAFMAELNAINFFEDYR